MLTDKCALLLETGAFRPDQHKYSVTRNSAPINYLLAELWEVVSAVSLKALLLEFYIPSQTNGANHNSNLSYSDGCSA